MEELDQLVVHFNADFCAKILSWNCPAWSLYSDGHKTSSGDLPRSLGFMAICLEDEIRCYEYNTESQLFYIVVLDYIKYCWIVYLRDVFVCHVVTVSFYVCKNRTF